VCGFVCGRFLLSPDPIRKEKHMAHGAVLDAEDIVTRWLEGIDLPGMENPAGPVFASGEFAEGDIVACDPPGSRCSSCSASARVFCC
jgi:hypothetical protein